MRGMSLKVVFLGTSAAVPTVSRSFPSTAIVREDEVILVDCGEGTQRQVLQAGLGFNKKMKILITHLHGDHVGGVTGLLQTMSMMRRIRPVDIYGPRGIRGLLKSTLNYLRVNLQYSLVINEVKEGVVVKEKEYEILSRRGSHSIRDYCYLFREFPRPGKFNVEKAIRLGIPEGPLWNKLQSGKAISIGEMVIEPSIILGASRAGRMIGFSGDTRPRRFFNRFFEKADLLVFEATYSEKDFEKAVQNMHTTATEAAKLASKANVKMLALVHLSSRYIDAEAILAEASRYHKNVIIPEDLTAVEIPYPESNEPLKVHRLSSS